MDLTLHPSAITAHLPLGHCCSSLSDVALNLTLEQLGGSLPMMDPRSYADLHGCSLIPVAHEVTLVYRYPHMRQLYLQSIVVRPTRALLPLPWFSVLESLRIQSVLTQLSGDAAIAPHLPSLLARMPRLRKLYVYGPQWPPGLSPQPDTGAPDVQYHDLPCSLEVIFLFGTLPIAACAHIISQSRGSLHELRVNAMDPSGTAAADDALLIFAIAQVAPHLRILDLRLGRDGRSLSPYTPVFAALALVETVDIETPQQAIPQDALDLLCHTPIRALTLRRPHHRSVAHAPAQVDVSRLQMPCLRSITLLNFALDGESRRDLLAYCQDRRIRCQVPTKYILFGIP